MLLCLGPPGGLPLPRPFPALPAPPQVDPHARPVVQCRKLSRGKVRRCEADSRAASTSLAQVPRAPGGKKGAKGDRST